MSILSIKCQTIFDITLNDIPGRFRPHYVDEIIWNKKKNTQSNFDTITQIISLRSQPEITKPPIVIYDFSNFGKNIDVKIAWEFEFEIYHSGVFQFDDQQFGLLYENCQGVPMIDTFSTNIKTQLLDVSTLNKNIHFEEISNEN